MENYNAVDETMMESALDDAAQAPDTVNALTEALDSVAAAQTGQNDGEGSDDGQDYKSESKALRGRMRQYEQRGYNRGLRELEDARSKWEQEKRGYDQQLSEYRKIQLENQARELAKEKNIPEDFALEYLKLKNGSASDAAVAPAAQAVEAKPDAGVNRESDAQARAAVLMTQADAFEKFSDGAVGRDAILDAFQSDPEVRSKVASGEWDFTDVGKHLMQPNARAHAPRANRSANNGRIAETTFSMMGEEDFARFDDQIRLGAVYDARR